MAKANPELNPLKVIADLLVGIPCCGSGCRARAMYGIYCPGPLQDLKLGKEVTIIAQSGHYHMVCSDHKDTYSGDPIPLSELTHLPVEWWDDSDE